MQGFHEGKCLGQEKEEGVEEGMESAFMPPIPTVTEGSSPGWGGWPQHKPSTGLGATAGALITNTLPLPRAEGQLSSF